MTRYKKMLFRSLGVRQNVRRVNKFKIMVDNVIMMLKVQEAK